MTTNVVYDNPGLAYVRGAQVLADVDKWHQLIANKEALTAAALSSRPVQPEGKQR